MDPFRTLRRLRGRLDGGVRGILSDDCEESGRVYECAICGLTYDRAVDACQACGATRLVRVWPGREDEPT